MAHLDADLTPPLPSLPPSSSNNRQRGGTLKMKYVWTFSKCTGAVKQRLCDEFQLVFSQPRARLFAMFFCSFYVARARRIQHTTHTREQTDLHHPILAAHAHPASARTSKDRRVGAHLSLESKQECASRSMRRHNP